MMTNKIWKYKIDSFDCKIEMPEGAKILSLQLQNWIPCIWVQVDVNNLIETRRFVTHPTGVYFHHAEKYIGTYQIGWYVWHVFEIIEKL